MHTNITPVPMQISESEYNKLVKSADKVEQHSFQDGVHEVVILNNKTIAFSETINYTEYYKTKG